MNESDVDRPDPRASDGVATAVVIGRAGSKGLPGKNALLVGGTPMIGRSVAHARQARTIGRVLCSTDGTEIAAAAEAAGSIARYIASGQRVAVLSTTVSSSSTLARASSPETLTRSHALAGAPYSA